ncbi:MAG: transcription-repair coupling factor, partial [Gammaproteobacteria bacterium]
GTNPDNAPLHKLGGDQWSRAKKKAAEKARDAAVELLDLYARRAVREGYAYPIIEHDYQAFVEAFPFEETTDQKITIDDVLGDMAGGKPMDRLVCGDVGFGKTEVALRASFVAAQGNRQVAVLVPTTLLAQQHYQNFCDRFADWPIKVEMLSRFRSAKQQKTILRGIQDGTVDIVIGTHALLSDRVRFKQMGLLIIDEEHRFGVRHKEILKNIRAEVDVLTLTATPIPRTLNISLSGIRDLSIIATPPVERLSIKTFVTEWNDVLVQEAVRREIRRGGQVYVVHNKVETIDKMAKKIADLVPESNVRVAHGQMRESKLERVMLDFYHRRFNVLVCSTIIESGIDVPTANTIVIDRADRFGLAQLHQLRGRVGRSHHRAYAYLFAPPRAVITADAVKRLEAIESMEDLGAGFTLATHDLEIRGAGELLGEEQSGQIQEVGFSLYSELLERAVAALKSGQFSDDDASYRHAPEVNLRTPALIPGDYVPDIHIRLVLYKRIAGAGSKEELDDLQVEMIDRFGLLPDATRRLFDITALKLRATPLGIRKLEASDQGGRIIFYPNPPIDGTTIIDLLQRKGSNYSVDGEEKLRFRMSLPTFLDRMNFLHDLLTTLSIPEQRGKGAA